MRKWRTFHHIILTTCWSGDWMAFSLPSRACSTEQLLKFPLLLLNLHMLKYLDMRKFHESNGKQLKLQDNWWVAFLHWWVNLITAQIIVSTDQFASVEFNLLSFFFGLSNILIPMKVPSPKMQFEWLKMKLPVQQLNWIFSKFCSHHQSLDWPFPYEKKSVYPSPFISIAPEEKKHS